MSDQFFDNRGGRGGRGGRGSRGGRGGPGDRGGGRGGRGGNNFNNRGGPGGQGGQGGGGGGGYNDRGGGNYRARGGGRGAGGGGGGGYRGRGGRATSPGRSTAFSLGGAVPVPNHDAAVDKLEDQIIKKQGASIADLTSKMGNVKLGSSSGKGSSSSSSTQLDHFPVRPSFGTNGNPVLLWANYFAVKVQPETFFKYTMKFSQRMGDGKFKAAELKGRKLRLVVQVVIADLKNKYPNDPLATEFKSQLITRTPLELAEMLVTFADGLAPEVYQVEFNGPTEARVSDMNTWLNAMTQTSDDLIYPRFPETVDALNVIFGFGSRSKDTVSAVGSARVFPFDKVVIGDNVVNLFSDLRPLMAGRGIFHSARLGTGRLLLNANVTHGVFKLSGRAEEIFNKFQIRPMGRDEARAGTGRNLSTLAKFLPKTRVSVEMMLDNGKIVNRNKAIYGLAKVSEISRSFKGDNPPRFAPGKEYPGPNDVKFWLEDGKGGGQYITVAQYYQKKYGKQLGNYPLLNLGRADRPTFYPVEVVTIVPGQPVKAKLTGSETTDMLSFACHSPHFNATHISTAGRKTLGLDDGCLGDFGITTDKNLLTVRGRVLNVPSILYYGSGQQRGTKQIRPRDGSWNMQNCKVVKAGKPLINWGFINIYNGHKHAPYVVDSATVESFANFMKESGMQIHSKPTALWTVNDQVVSVQRGDFLNGIDGWFAKAKARGIQFILFILQERDSSGLYAEIKLMGDCVYGIHTSIVIGSKFRPFDPKANQVKASNQAGFFANIALKWNLKLGGANHALSNELGLLKEGKTMIVGYDVTHPTNMPAGKDTDVPSIAGLVASIDKHLGQWPAVAWEQPSRQEMLKGRLVGVFKSRLDLWYKSNKALPENIVIFRDGVSEGQFAQVLEHELPRIREACRLKYGDKSRQPKISIIVSVKRHQTRFYPTNVQQKTDSGNIQPGTIVDRGVTQARYWDFFLTAHNALQGTARPAHYTVLLDEIFRTRYKDQAANELEKVTHELCYLYGRATKAVSICPPAYYADIVCERARAYRPDMFEASDVASLESGATGAGGHAAQATRTRDVHPDLADTMYYI